MATAPRSLFLASLSTKFGRLRPLGGPQSLFDIADSARVYVRYSKVHERGQTFFGLRVSDLRQLEGINSFIAFIWNDQVEPLLIPFGDFEDVLADATPATDGQIKIQVYQRDAGTELYISRLGRFKVDSYFGWQRLEQSLTAETNPTPDLSHCQVQSLLGAIGVAKNFDVWIPPRDRYLLDWTICQRFSCVEQLTYIARPVDFVLQEIDVIWIERGSGRLKSLYEVEHSTTIYSGLLRLNDARLTFPEIESYAIVANVERRSVFSRHLKRPTFQVSGLESVCSFLEYPDVYRWHESIYATERPAYL